MRKVGPEPRAKSLEPRAQIPKPKAQSPKLKAQSPKPKACHSLPLKFPNIPTHCDFAPTLRYHRCSMNHTFQTDDARLPAIKDKVLVGERLNETDALTLYRTGDILAVGWLANYVRERLHGNKAYFNVNRHINPTNVCVA